MRNSMNYLKKIEFLENLAQQARNINATTSSEPIFKMWRHDVKTELAKIYGKESFELTQFEKVRFYSLAMMNRRSGDSDLDRKAFHEGMEEAIKYGYLHYMVEISSSSKSSSPPYNSTKVGI